MRRFQRASIPPYNDAWPSCAETWVELRPGRGPARLTSSRGAVDSRDARRHVAWMLEQLRARPPAAGACAELHWVSAHGHGGPSLHPQHMAELGRLGVSLRLVVHFLVPTL